MMQKKRMKKKILVKAVKKARKSKKMRKKTKMPAAMEVGLIFLTHLRMKMK